MDPQTAIDISRNALFITTVISAPVLVAGVVVGLGEHLEAIAAGRLGLVQGRIAALEQVVEGIAVQGPDGQADRHRHLHGLAGHLHGLLDAAGNALGRGVGRGIGRAF